MFSRLGTNWRTEILAGVTTFLTMAYIVLVNPAILDSGRISARGHRGNMPFGSVRLHLDGHHRGYPIALAPGMGLNAYFTYTVCIKMHSPGRPRLALCFFPA